MQSLVLLTALFAPALALVARNSTTSNSTCHYLPGDSGWPSSSTWDQLNSTVNGKLIATVPLGHVCHEPTYDAIECLALQTAWQTTTTHVVSSSSIMEAYFANQSCDPFTSSSTPCLLGNYVSYAVNVTSSADVVSTINFAKENNIRFVIRNTGHDYFGRSTGAGALAVWTQGLKDIEVLDWADANYTGRAMKFGAGVLGYEAVEAAANESLVILSGTCPTVGAAGGYIQGGGHSPLSTNFGLAADQALEFEVVTASGDVVTASATNNTDLYWALAGGGPGTYGVIISATVRAHADTTIGGASLQIISALTTTDKYYAAVAQFHAMLPNMTDQGATLAFLFSSSYLVVSPLTAYNQTSDQVKAILAPFLAYMDVQGVPYVVEYTQYDSYLDHYTTFMGPLPEGHLEANAYNFGGRLVPRSVLENNSSNTDLQTALRNITQQGVLVVSVALDVSSESDRPNSVSPYWRKAAIEMQLTTTWDNTATWAEDIANQLEMTNDFMPLVEAATPGSGSYINEGDFRQPNWQDTFYGDNYQSLLAVKNKWDPNGVLYGLKLVGSDAWTVADDGRMCKA